MTAPVTAPRPLVLNPSESELLRAVVELAQWRGWLVDHPIPSYNQGGQVRTYMQGNPGRPDLWLAPRPEKLPERVHCGVELKTARGRTTPEQMVWLAATGGYLWRPDDYFNGFCDDFLRAPTEKVAREVARMAGWCA